MNTRQNYCSLLKSLVVIALISFPFIGTAAADTITATIGDTIPLNGTVQLTDTVYLFVTGPGIPAQGARMDNSNSQVVTGDPDTFTQVMVKNDRWTYSWNTARVSGGLAPGSHTVYVSTEPVAKNSLSGVKYAEVDIILKKAVTTGRLDVRTDPADAEIYLNGKYSGNTPRVFESLLPGEYVIQLEKQGYATAQGSVILAAGDDIPFSRSLTPLNTPATTPANQETFGQVTVQETSLPTPTVAPSLMIWVIAGLGIAGLLTRIRS